MFRILVICLVLCLKTFDLALEELSLFQRILHILHAAILSVTVPWRTLDSILLDIPIFRGNPIHLFKVFEIQLALVIALTSSLQMILLH